jgi:glycosyltransferase involved in cell wall biosynthesis
MMRYPLLVGQKSYIVWTMNHFKVIMFLCPVLFVLLVLFLACVLVQSVYVIRILSRALAIPPGSVLAESERQPATVLICAKNEAANLKKNLPKILSQRYCNASGISLYEVLVVNDGSTDESTQVLNELARQYKHLRIATCEPDVARVLKGKKHALGTGVASAVHEWLLLTDADCAPNSEEWLARMVAPLAGGNEIVAGYSGYIRRRGLLNAFIRWETLHTFIQYSGYIMSGMPYMSVGRNMACTKSVLLNAQQHPMWNALPSGDDDLLVAIAGTDGNTAVIADEAAFTFSEAKPTWAEWIAQKQRHLSTGKYYKPAAKRHLAAYAGAHSGTWIFFVPLLFSVYWQMILACMSLRSVAKWLLWYATAKKVKEKNLTYFFPLFDFGWMVYNFAFLPYIAWKNKDTWK